MMKIDLDIDKWIDDIKERSKDLDGEIRKDWECEWGPKHSEPMGNGCCKWCGELVKDT